MSQQIASLRALVNGVRDPGKLFVMVGDYCVYGCKITQGTSASDLYLALDGQASGDSAHLNPDIESNPLRTEEYPNIAWIYGEAFLSNNINTVDQSNDSLLLDDAPGTANYGRYDIVYAYIGQAGPAVAILTGTAAAAVKTDFVANGLDTSPYPSTFDPTLPKGAFPLARVYIQTGDTGIANARIADLRDFHGKLNPLAATGRHELNTGNGTGAVNVAVRRLLNVVKEECPGITYTDSANNGGRFECTEAGWFKVLYEEVGGGSGGTSPAYAGITVNSTELTTGIESITNLSTLETRFTTRVGLNDRNGNACQMIRLEVGDFFVLHVTPTTFAAESSLTRVVVEKMFDI